MPNESKLTVKLMFWILGLMGTLLIIALGWAYNGITSDLEKLDVDLEKVSVQVTKIDKKVDNRDIIDSLLVYGYRDHETRLRLLEGQ